MKKKKVSKLVLHKETIAQLNDSDMNSAQGGLPPTLTGETCTVTVTFTWPFWTCADGGVFCTG